MKLNGTKLITASVLSLITTITQAETIAAPALTTFTAGTPAKAAEVNANFAGLKTYDAALTDVVNAQAALIEALEAKVESLHTIIESEPNSFTIPVKGDGELIGYTDSIPDIAIGGSMLVKTDYGIIKLKGDYSDGYQLGYYNEMNSTSEYFSGPNYTDAACTTMIFAISPGEGNPVIFTKVAGIVDKDQIFVGENNSWLIEAGTTFNRNNTSFYYKDGENCVEATWLADGTISIPMIELNPEVHGLKQTYSSISIDGYVLN